MINSTCLADYKYARKPGEIAIYYFTETITISLEESNYIKSLTPTPISISFPSKESNSHKKQKKKIIIDTDFGTDIDDTLAIFYALHLQEEAEILLITTNYGIPELRSKILKKYIDSFYKFNPSLNKNGNFINVLEGASLPLGSHRMIFLYGNEGLPFFPEENKEIFKYREEDKIKNKYKHNISHKSYEEQCKASEEITKIIKKYPNEVTIVSIGIPSNIALAIKNHKEIIPLVKEIVLMGCGSFIPLSDKKNDNEFHISHNSDIKENDTISIKNLLEKGKIIQMYPNHNISGDTLATKIIFDSGIPVKVLTHEVTKNFSIPDKIIEYFNKEKEKIEKGRNINEDLTPEEFVGTLNYEVFSRGRKNWQCPHDPLTIHESVFSGEKSHVLYARGNLVVHEWAAFSTFIPCKDGKHLIGIETRNENEFLEQLSEKLMEGNEINKEDFMKRKGDKDK